MVLRWLLVLLTKVVGWHFHSKIDFWYYAVVVDAVPAKDVVGFVVIATLAVAIAKVVVPLPEFLLRFVVVILFLILFV